MEYQIDTRQRNHEVRVGRDQREVAVFRKVAFFIYNLEGSVDGVDYQMKLPAPWTGFRYRLRRGEQELASAKRVGRLHAFEPDQPYLRHRLVELELDLAGRSFRWTPEDRHGQRFVLFDGEQRCGCLNLRSFEAQAASPWQADLELPDDWPVPYAAFLAWLAREGRRAMGS